MLKTIAVIFVIFLVFAGLWGYNWYMGKVAPSIADEAVSQKGEAVAYFAGGCFWCIESDYEKLPEVKEAISGYMGGDVKSPSYKQVSSGDTGHREVVKVVYDPQRATYRELVLYLLKHTDPTDQGGSFFDRGYQYTSAIYYQTNKEKEIAEDVVKELEDKKIFDKPIATKIEKAGTFWVAEDYHQDYYKKSSLQYKYYRSGSGRDAFIKSVWGDGEHSYTTENKSEAIASKNANNTNLSAAGAWQSFEKPNEETLRKKLTPLQYDVTQSEGTERAFENEYWDNHRDGIYVDIVSGEPLFSSTDKFDSGTGWPSFLKPLDKDFVTEKQDYKLILPRTEIRSKYSDSHLGHIILDGPIENDKIRYCMNSAALRFVPKEEMSAEGYADYLYLFE